MQGLHKLHSNTASQPQTQVNPLADLEDMFALTSAEPEQEPAAASVPVLAPGHDSAACQQQVETTVQRMLGMVANNEELQQPLVSHLNKTEGTLARIQANHQNGSAIHWPASAGCRIPGVTLWSGEGSWGWMLPTQSQGAPRQHSSQ